MPFNVMNITFPTRLKTRFSCCHGFFYQFIIFQDVKTLKDLQENNFLCMHQQFGCGQWNGLNFNV